MKKGSGGQERDYSQDLETVENCDEVLGKLGIVANHEQDKTSEQFGKETRSWLRLKAVLKYPCEIQIIYPDQQMDDDSKGRE